MSERSITTESTYGDKIIKLVPGEFVAVFIAIDSALRASALGEPDRHFALAVSGVILLVLLPFFLKWKLNVSSASHIFVSTVSFVIWFTSIENVLTTEWWYRPVYSTIAMMLWTLMSPLFVKR